MQKLRARARARARANGDGTQVFWRVSEGMEKYYIKVILLVIHRVRGHSL